MSRSILQDRNRCRCYICEHFCGDDSVKPYLEEHHVFGGPLRSKSEHYGLKIYLCRKHHTGDITGGGDCVVYSKLVKPTGAKCSNWRKRKEKKYE